MKHAMDHPITPAFLLRFTLPSIVMMIVLSMYTVVDGTLVSHLVGTEAVSYTHLDVYKRQPMTCTMATCARGV